MKSTAGFVLALIGGIGTLLIGIVQLVNIRANPFLNILPSFVSNILTGIMVWLFIVGIVTIWAAFKMRKNDNAQVKKGGIIAIVCGVVGFNLLTLIGGIIGVVQAGKVAAPLA
jgi:hypothetical protein